MEMLTEEGRGGSREIEQSMENKRWVPFAAAPLQCRTMFRKRRLKRVHARFLESCRSLSGGADYWSRSGLGSWLAQLLTPIPLLALHDEGKHVYEALLWLEANCRSRDVDVELVRHYHRLLRPKGPEAPGEFRKGTVRVDDSRHARPPAARVPSLISQFDARLRAEQKRLDDARGLPAEDVVRTATELHQGLVLIHPFADANGRVARLLMNHLLRRYGHGYVVLPPLHLSREHFVALEEAPAGDPSRLHRLSLDSLHSV